MIGTLSRRLRVRDDGTGKGRENDSTFAEFATEDAIILLGDPGMGKTTFLRDASNGQYVTVRNFLIDPHGPVGEPLFLDALDEYRTLANGQDASAEIAKALCALKKPAFRLSCRAADWFGAPDQEAFRTASASGRVVVLELCPLSWDEILHAVQEMVPDPAVFLEEAESAGLGKLLGNPQTLDLIARAWGTKTKPRNKFEAYEIGINELLKETNIQHVVRGVTSPNPHDLRKAAGAAASTLLLSNSVGIARIESVDGKGYVSLPVVPYPNKNDLEAVLRRRLFISPEVDRFEPAHRTMAEFLAAEDLLQRIANGLPIDRVMALICGGDRKPVASLRGLFAWLMCRLRDLAESYVERDPYGVATYGDASVLPPNAQRALWTALRELHDPWFLTNEDDRGSFRDLANFNTDPIIHQLLQDPATGVHLQIAALEAIANSTENIGLHTIIRSMVLEKHDNIWLRSTALRAFARAVQNNWTSLEMLDAALAHATDDPAAPEVRVELLRLTQACGNLAQRVLSILEQVASARKTRRVLGYFFPLIDLPSTADLDGILDGASRVLMSMSTDCVELRSLFDAWLKRRLESPTSITPVQLANWLRNVSREISSKETLAFLQVRFAQKPSLFEEVFVQLVNDVPNEERSFWLFVSIDLWELLPPDIWPVPLCEFFLAQAEKERDPERAADLFCMYVSRFPSEGASVVLAEAGFDVLDRRHDVTKALGNWQSCKIDRRLQAQWERREQKRRKQSEQRTQNVAYLISRLTTIRAGSEEQALVWAAMIYQDFCNEMNDISDARERLVSVTNDEIADACIAGFIQCAENPTIPTKEAVIASWLANSSPYTHALLSLSVFLRLKAGMTVPTEALPHCIAAVVTAVSPHDRVPGYDETLSGWLIQEARQHPAVVSAVLKEIWVSSATIKRGILPRFYELSHDPGSQQFLVALSADVLKTGINEDHATVDKLVSVLLRHDQRAALAIGETELARNELSAAVQAIWSTIMFVIDPSTYLEPWRALMAGPNATLWQAIEVIGSGPPIERGSLRITSVQRMAVITTIGRRFANVERWLSSWSGSQNAWDASEFVANQIRLLAADGTPDVEAQFEQLENDDGLASYRDLIRHYRAQHAKQQRELSFTFASPEHIAEALQNRDPATPGDLLAFIVDHLGALAHELTRTQRERYRAYWNEDGRNLLKPKREEVCSGFLAEDLQHRIRAHTLIVTVEHHMIADKECDLVVLQGTERLLPIEVKHPYHDELWTAWRTQLDRLYTRDAKAGGFGIYLVLWSGEAKGRMMPKLPHGLQRPASAAELRIALESLIPQGDRHRLRVVVVDIAKPS